MAERLNALAPGSAEKRSFFVNSGAEAIENAVKIARSFTGRQAVVVFDHAFHGRTLLTMSLTAKAMPYKSGFGPFAPEVYRVPFSYPYRCAAGAPPELCGEACADLAITAMDKQIGGNRIACLLVEPVQGEGGVIIPGEGFLPRLAEYCKEHGIVFIADEVQAGMARTGKLFSSSTSGIVPDLITTAKGLGGGLPIGGSDGPGRHHGRHPSRRPRLDLRWQPRVVRRGPRRACRDRVAATSSAAPGRSARSSRPVSATSASEVPAVGDVRVIGAMAALEFVTDREDARARPRGDLRRCSPPAMREGVILLKAGTYDNVVRILPPLVISDDLLNDGLVGARKGGSGALSRSNRRAGRSSRRASREGSPAALLGSVGRAPSPAGRR